MKHISVIIPVYNAEKHLEKCIGSLLAQTETSCEFIFVNDGSKDGSRKIIEEFQERDDRIVLINQENQGVSRARNNGIASATGDYIGFADADDYAEPDLFEKMYTAATTFKADIVTANYFEELAGAKIKTALPFAPDAVFKKDAIVREIIPFFIREEILNQCWNKLYSSRLIHSKHVVFPAGVPIGEDGFFNLQAFLAAETAVFIDYAGYHYQEVDGSATRNILRHDYFKTAMDLYRYDYQGLTDALPPEEINKLKAVKLLKHVLTIVGIYLKPGDARTYFKRLAYVKKVIGHPEVQRALALYGEEIKIKKTRYQKILLNCIGNKNLLLLTAAVLYSNFRNR